MNGLQSLAILVLVLSMPARAADRVHVAVFGLFHSSQVEIELSPAFPMLVEAGQRQLVVGVDARQSVTVCRSGSGMVLRAGGTQIAGERFSFTARQGGEPEFVLAVPGKLRRRYRGNLTITVGKGELLTVVDMEIETAVASIVSAEVEGDTPLEALKAQAVVSRSYLLGSAHRHIGADFCDTTHCQFLREPPSSGSRAFLATRATRGQVLAWRGKLFAAMYSASCGGRTRSLAQVGDQDTNYPYFSVECVYCQRAPEKWSSRLSRPDGEGLTSNSEHSRVQVGRKLGWNAVPSNTYTQSSSVDSVDLNGLGRGHGVGLCQRGAQGMALEGKDYRSILAHYFPNTTVVSNSAH